MSKIRLSHERDMYPKATTSLMTHLHVTAFEAVKNCILCKIGDDEAVQILDLCNMVAKIEGIEFKYADYMALLPAELTENSF